MSPNSTTLNLADVPCGEAGRQSRVYNGRIMGGSEIKITDFPHTVSLRKNGEHWCGGVLITRNHVLTAAHCVHSYPISVWDIAVGDQNSIITEGNEQILKVDEIIVHEQYKFPRFVNDIAVMRLAKPVEWSPNAQPICLPNQLHRTGKARGFLAGWGYDKEEKKGGKPTEALHVARLPIMENEQCQEWFHSMGKKIKLRPNHLCAGYEQGKQDGCQGDSGGGLVALEHHKDDLLPGQKLVLVGVMSAGIGCGREKLPGIYTRVEKFIPWIMDTVAQDQKLLLNRNRRALEEQDSGPWNPRLRRHLSRQDFGAADPFQEIETGASKMGVKVQEPEGSLDEWDEHDF